MQTAEGQFGKQTESKAAICNITVIYKELTDNLQPLGQYVFPFEITLPNWLPPSTMLSNEANRCNMQIRYEARAQVSPLSGSDEWANETEGVSKLRGSKSFFLCSEHNQVFPTVNLRQELKLEIGGVWGFGN